MCCYLSKEEKNDMIDTIKDFFFDGNDGCDQDCINCLDIEYCHTIALQKLKKHLVMVGIIQKMNFGSNYKVVN